MLPGTRGRNLRALARLSSMPESFCSPVRLNPAVTPPIALLVIRAHMIQEAFSLSAANPRCCRALYCVTGCSRLAAAKLQPKTLQRREDYEVLAQLSRQM